MNRYEKKMQLFHANAQSIVGRKKKHDADGMVRARS